MFFWSGSNWRETMSLAALLMRMRLEKRIVQEQQHGLHSHRWPLKRSASPMPFWLWAASSSSLEARRDSARFAVGVFGTRTSRAPPQDEKGATIYTPTLISITAVSDNNGVLYRTGAASRWATFANANLQGNALDADSMARPGWAGREQTCGNRAGSRLAAGLGRRHQSACGGRGSIGVRNATWRRTSAQQACSSG